MNRDQAVNIVASHLVTLVADASLEEVSGITRSGLDRMSTEELALLDVKSQDGVKYMQRWELWYE